MQYLPHLWKLSLTAEVCHLSCERDHQETSSCKCPEFMILSQTAGCFTTMIANALRKYRHQSGIDAGIFNASNKPVTTALEVCNYVLLSHQLVINPLKEYTGSDSDHYYQ